MRQYVLTTDQADPVDQVRALLENQYVDPVSEDVLEADTIEEMLDKLDDPYTTYMTREVYEDFLDSLDRTFSGIGIYFEMVAEGVLVISVIADGPAERAELLPGDIIITADGQPMQGLSSEEAVSIIRGPKGTDIDLKIERNGTIKEIVITREEITIDYITGESVNNDIGYLNLISFGSDIGDLFNEEANPGQRILAKD